MNKSCSFQLRPGAWRLPAVCLVFALLLAGCAPKEPLEPLQAFRWHGHDEVIPPRPAESSSRVPVPAPPVLNTVKSGTLTEWEEFMANEAAAKLRAGLASTADRARRDELCAEFLVRAIQERISAFPKEKIDYSLCVMGIDSGLASPPKWRKISNDEHFKLNDKAKDAELKTYYEHCNLFENRERMLKNINLVFEDNRLGFEAAMGRFPLVMMLHYEQIGRGIVLREETRKLREAL